MYNDEHMTKVAVITRTKDRPLFLTRSLRSVAEQSYLEYVHVIVNDGGNVGEVNATVSLLSPEQKNKTHVFHRDHASDAPDTIFNESIDQVDSEYFVIHDDDDTWDKDFLARTVKHLDEHKELGAVVVRTDKVLEEVIGNTIEVRKTAPWMPDIKTINLYRQCIDNQFTPIATLFRRSAYKAVGKFDETLPVVGDWEFGVRLLQKYDADYIDPGHALAYYHHRAYKSGVEGNTSFAGNDRHRYYSNLVMNRYLRKELADGRIGVGYIMSQLKYNQANTASLISRFLPKSIVDRLKKRASN